MREKKRRTFVGLPRDNSKAGARLFGAFMGRTDTKLGFQGWRPEGVPRRDPLKLGGVVIKLLARITAIKIIRVTHASHVTSKGSADADELRDVFRRFSK